VQPASGDDFRHMAKIEEGHRGYRAFNHLISPGQDRGRGRQAERVGRLAVHRDFAFGRLLDRQFGRPRALQDRVDVSVAPVKGTALCACRQGVQPGLPERSGNGRTFDSCGSG
jgi:hypothetical protein